MSSPSRNLAPILAVVTSLALMGGVASQFTASSTTESSTAPAKVEQRLEQQPPASEDGTHKELAPLFISLTAGSIAGGFVLARRRSRRIARPSTFAAVAAPEPKHWSETTREYLQQLQPDRLGLQRAQVHQMNGVCQAALEMLSSHRLAHLDTWYQEQMRLLLDEHLPEALRLHGQSGDGRQVKAASDRQLSVQLSSIAAELARYQAIADQSVLSKQQVLSSLLEDRNPANSSLSLEK